MSHSSHSSSLSVISSPVATSPKYSLSGIANAINQSRSRNGMMSTMFGRGKGGVADRIGNPFTGNEFGAREYVVGNRFANGTRASGVSMIRKTGSSLSMTANRFNRLVAAQPDTPAASSTGAKVVNKTTSTTKKSVGMPSISNVFSVGRI